MSKVLSRRSALSAEELMSDKNIAPPQKYARKRSTQTEFPEWLPTRALKKTSDIKTGMERKIDKRSL
jgi:hypothetical protein